MSFLKKQPIAIGIMIVTILISSVYGVSKRPTMSVPDENINVPSDSGGEIVTPPTNGSEIDKKYVLAKAYFDAGNYGNAIIELRTISESSVSYLDAKTLLIAAEEAYRNEALDSAAAQAEKGEYYKAVQALESALQILQNDAELVNMSAEYTVKYREKVKADTIDTAMRYSNDGDYAAALMAVITATNLIGEDPDLSSLYAEYFEKYRSSLIARADSALEETGYEAAIEIIKEGLNIFPDDSVLLAAIEEYKAYAPVYLCEDIDYLRISERTVVTLDEYHTDNNGEEYSGHYVIYDHRSGFIMFAINKNYKTFNGTIFLPYRYGGTWRDAHIYIYGDNKLLYQSNEITMGYQAETFSINVSDISILEIRFSNDDWDLDSSNWAIGCLTNAYLLK